jgi:PAS domain S-box-containing protein
VEFAKGQLGFGKSEEEKERHRTRILEVFNRVGRVLVAEFELQKIVQSVTDGGREIANAAFGAFFYEGTNGRGEAYALYALSGEPHEAFAKAPMPQNSTLFSTAFHDAGVQRIGDVLKDPRYGQSTPFQGMPKGFLPVRSYLAVPVVSRSGAPLGGLFYGHPEPNVFSQESETALVSLAAQAAIAIDNAHLHAALRQDLKHQRQGWEDAQRLAAIVESSDDAIISKDLNGTIMSWNRGAARIFGFTAEEAIGKSILILIPADRHKEEASILDRIGRGERIDHFDTVRQHKDGSLIDISLTVSPVNDSTGKIVGASKIARDVTARKRTERELRETKSQLAAANAGLEQRVEERTASLREAIGHLEEFSYSVSHDLRAPVRAMQAYARALLEDYAERLGGEGTMFLQRIVESGARMDRLIRDVLTYSRLTRADIHLHRVDLDQFLPDIARNYPELEKPRAEIIVKHPLAVVIGHEPSLSQTISNLLTNAVKFVAPGTFPVVLVRTERIGDCIRLWVEDNGIGIKPEHQKRLFGLFERLHPNSSYEGTGIGLAIVRKAVDRMQGRVGVESDGVHGSKFWLELPAAD